MATVSFVDNDNVAVNGSSETTEDVKNVLFHFKTILNSTDSNGIIETTSSEPTVPTKSSSEILCELFSAFNAEPPNIPENFEDIETKPGSSSPRHGPSESLDDKIKVNRKCKTRRSRTSKKHKDKRHKPKKKRKSEYTESNSNSPSCRAKPSYLIKKRIKEDRDANNLSSVITSVDSPVKKRIKKEKGKSKLKTGLQSKHSRPNDSVLRSVKLKHVAADPKSTRLLGLSIEISNDVTYDDRIAQCTTDVEIPYASPRSSLYGKETRPASLGLGSPLGVFEYENIKQKIKIEPGTEPIEEQPSASNNESCITVCQAKNTSKISIKSLKFSSVFQATVREVEEQAKAKADKYEEGEISNSDCDELVLSPISSIESGDKTVASTSSFYQSSHKKGKKCRKRHRSGSGERSSKHHHSSKRKKETKGEGDNKISDLCASSHRHKHHDRRKRRNANGGIEKKKCKRRNSLNSTENHRMKSSSSLKSPTPKLKKDSLTLLNKSALCDSLEGNDKMVVSTSGTKTVEELTNFCKQLSRKEQGNRSGSEEDEEYDSDSEIEQPFHHPFHLKERPQSIVVNIRNSIQLPVKSLQEKAAEQSKHLRVQFPVSSGQRHRKAEDEWVPVFPKCDTAKRQPSITDSNPKPTPAITHVSGTASVKDIGSIVTQKLRAMRTLQENPNDVEALGAMFRANQDMLHWAEVKQNQGQTAAEAPGLAVTGAIAGSQTMCTVTAPAPVTACSGRVGMGMSLLQKMGWKPGEGLGKNREGVLEPLKLEFKMDKKGLMSAEDLKASPKYHATDSGGQPSMSSGQCKPCIHNAAYPLGKHPINKLVELCVHKRWRGPQFELCYESGPDHRKNFLFKVLVNGNEYKPMVTSLTKKQAKTEAASICLQAFRDLRT